MIQKRVIKTHPKHNVVRIQVEAKAPRRRRRTIRRIVSKPKPRVSIEKVKIEMQPVLVDNFVSLQKAMINLASKLDSANVRNEKVILNLAEKLENVSAKIEKLLELFEISAKSLAKRDFKIAGEINSEVMTKLNDLSEQNKLIARGVSLMHEAHSEVPVLSYPPQNQPPIIEEEYKKSVSFKPFNSPE